MAGADEYELGRLDVAQKVAAELGEEEVPDGVWGSLDKRGLIYDAWREGEGSAEWKELISVARAEQRRTRSDLGPPAGLPGRQAQPVTGEVTVQTDEYTEHRARAWAEVAEALATQDGFVREFRHVHLGAEDAVLPEEEAGCLLYGNGPQAVVSEDLQLVADRLRRNWQWRMQDAYWFVLTGRAPRVKPLSVKVGMTGTWVTGRFRAEKAQVTIIAEPWVKAEHVERAYREASKQLRGGANYEMDRRTLDAAIFVARQIKDRGRPSWEEMRKSWNASNPERPYKGRNGLLQAFGNLLSRDYREPSFAPYEREPWQRRRDDAQELIRQRVEERGRRLPPRRPFGRK